jgi:thiosulfate/3-mercaptopyruvate sulfurtransferase
MTAYQTLITPADLGPHTADPAWAVVDCRFLLRDPPAGRRAYLEGHIPGAVYAHLNDDLSGPVIPGRTGRHPLPEPAELAQRFSLWGIDGRTQVVAYDDSGGSMAARLWWALKWLGHDAAAVLDGGWQAWQQAGLPRARGEERRTPRRFVSRLRPGLAVSAETVNQVRAAPDWRVLDARAAERFRGENETIDPVAGHIPGALSAPFADNLDAEGRFRGPGELRARYQRLLGGAPAERVVAYCGSGVTAAHDVLAMAYAGLGEARLYAGSWSEWITDPARPVAIGE